MSHRHSRWFREAVESKPLYRLTCQLCGHAVLTYDPELSKVHHQGERHFGHPMQYTQRREPERATEAGAQ